jgi:hypothetical protein
MATIKSVSTMPRTETDKPFVIAFFQVKDVE